MQDRDQWIAETQMFQRTAGTQESTYEELAAEWGTFTTKRRKRALESIKTHTMIQRVTQET